MFTRIALAIPFGVAATAALLIMMNHLIVKGEVELAPTSARIVGYTRVEREKVVQRKDERPEPPEAPTAMPELAMLDVAELAPVTIKVALNQPRIDLSTDITGPNMAISDGDYLPMYKAAPEYPVTALRRHLEGYVIVEFVVTTSGAVRDVEVVESTSPIFEQAAIEAAKKFKYKPRVIDGQPFEVYGVQNKLTFKLDA